MKTNKIILIIVLTLHFTLTIFCQTNKYHKNRIMFYNTENLFHPTNDSIKDDDEFTPEGIKHWNNQRYHQKLYNIYKIITAVGEEEMPDIIGLSEIENQECLYDLINKTPLFLHNYQFIHFESPDNRGIDVALLYRPDKFQILKSRNLPIVFPSELSSSATRDILYAYGILNKKDTLHLFINHWPSKYSGANATEPLRIHTAKYLKKHTDSIFKINYKANIIITGDFNDNPLETSIYNALCAQTQFDTILAKQLYNLSYHLQFKEQLWTHKNQDQSDIIDQFIVSSNLLSNTCNLCTQETYTHIYSSIFILEPDEQNLNFKPFRTYAGMKYKGGFSDHLPIYLDLYSKK